MNKADTIGSRSHLRAWWYSLRAFMRKNPCGSTSLLSALLCPMWQRHKIICFSLWRLKKDEITNHLEVTKFLLILSILFPTWTALLLCAYIASILDGTGERHWGQTIHHSPRNIEVLFTQNYNSQLNTLNILMKQEFYGMPAFSFLLYNLKSDQIRFLATQIGL